MARSPDQRMGKATRLGSYEIIRRFAEGGMAELYLARTVGPEGFEKLVVLKKILPLHATNPTFVRLFTDEARLGASLHHPNIATVYDIGTVDGDYFFAMEFVHGQDVRAILRRSIRLGEAFPLEHAVQIARDIAAALNHAHERRGPDGVILDIVHRDVSPSNIVVSYDGVVKLLDFGVAKTTTRSIKTETGTLKGKVSYMSPEQARGAPIDRRSDVYSLGIVLWELIATRRLHKGDNDLATIHRIANEPPPSPTLFRRDCPPELECIVGRALATDPEQRYPTAEELQSELEVFAREHKLAVSSIALSRHICRLFADEVRAWRDAENTGITLSAHMAERPGDPTTVNDVDSDLDSGESEPALPPTTVATPDPSVRAPAPTDEMITLEEPASETGTDEARTTPSPLVPLLRPLMPTSIATLVVPPPSWRPSTHAPAPASRLRRIALISIAAIGVASAIGFAIGRGASDSVSAPPTMASPPHPVEGPALDPVAAGPPEPGLASAPTPTSNPTPVGSTSPSTPPPQQTKSAARDPAKIVQKKIVAPKRPTATKAKPSSPPSPSTANVVSPASKDPPPRHAYDPNDPFPPQ